MEMNLICNFAISDCFNTFIEHLSAEKQLQIKQRRDEDENIREFNE